MSDWTKRTQKIKVGDSVGYSKQFLRSIGQLTGHMPSARGTVVALHSLGSETLLAEINWNCGDLPSRVNVKNLSTVRQIQLGE